ncbi:hypothetical protein HY095_03880 [Candidatus Micrarchaeota archaeon]|nr:hypothetical protein [Candidatus Micrarchaeota archaeon]
METRYVVGIVVVLLVGAGLIYLLSPQPAAQAAATPTPESPAVPEATATPKPSFIPLVTPTPVPAGATPVATNQVAIINGGFTPFEISVKAGITVAWENDDGVLHDFSVTSGPEKFSSGLISPRQKFSRQMNAVGTYEYVESRYGTKGRIIVQ